MLHLDESRPEPPTIDGAISRREAVILSIAAHVVLILLVLWAPSLPFLQHLAQAARLPEPEVVPQARREPPQPFIMVEPRVDLETLNRSQRAPLSDKDRVARTPERPPEPRNPQPFSRGNTSELVEAQRQAPQKPPGQGPSPEPSRAQGGINGSTAGQAQASALPVPEAPQGQFRREDSGNASGGAPAGGALGDVLRDLKRYTQNQQLDNRQGGATQFGFQFDSKGVEFGPWLRRFVAQVRRNWEPLIPQAAWTLRGHVVLTFNVHKNGAITDLQVIKPSAVNAFNSAAFNALGLSNPTMPLPPEYPSDRAFFTVTFFYNETPPGQ